MIAFQGTEERRLFALTLVVGDQFFVCELFLTLTQHHLVLNNMLQLPAQRPEPQPLPAIRALAILLHPRLDALFAVELLAVIVFAHQGVVDQELADLARHIVIVTDVDLLGLIYEFPDAEVGGVSVD